MNAILLQMAAPSWMCALEAGASQMIEEDSQTCFHFYGQLYSRGLSNWRDGVRAEISSDFLALDIAT